TGRRLPSFSAGMTIDSSGRFDDCSACTTGSHYTGTGLQFRLKSQLNSQCQIDWQALHFPHSSADCQPLIQGVSISVEFARKAVRLEYYLPARFVNPVRG